MEREKQITDLLMGRHSLESKNILHKLRGVYDVLISRIATGVRVAVALCAIPAAGACMEMDSPPHSAPGVTAIGTVQGDDHEIVSEKPGIEIQGVETSDYSTLTLIGVVDVKNLGNQVPAINVVVKRSEEIITDQDLPLNLDKYNGSFSEDIDLPPDSLRGAEVHLNDLSGRPLCQPLFFPEKNS